MGDENYRGLSIASRSPVRRFMNLERLVQERNLGVIEGGREGDPMLYMLADLKSNPEMTLKVEYTCYAQDLEGLEFQKKLFETFGMNDMFECRVKHLADLNIVLDALSKTYDLHQITILPYDEKKRVYHFYVLEKTKGPIDLTLLDEDELQELGAS